MLLFAIIQQAVQDGKNRIVRARSLFPADIRNERRLVETSRFSCEWPAKRIFASGFNEEGIVKSEEVKIDKLLSKLVDFGGVRGI